MAAINGASPRPYRLWHSKEKKQLPYRYFVYSKKAHMGALIEARWAKIGITIEVININTGKMLGQYTRHPHTVSFKGE